MLRCCDTALECVNRPDREEIDKCEANTNIAGGIHVS